MAKRKRLRRKLKVRIRSERKTIPKGPFRDNTHFQLVTMFDADLVCDCLSSSMGVRIYPENTLVTSKAMDTVMQGVKQKVETYLNDHLRFDDEFWKAMSLGVAPQVKKLQQRNSMSVLQNRSNAPPTILNGRKQRLPETAVINLGYTDPRRHK